MGRIVLKGGENMDYEFPRGDTFLFPDKFRFVDSNGEPLNTNAGDKVYVTFRKDSKSKKKILQKTIGNGITKDSNGYFSVLLSSNDTANLKYGTYGFDISYKTADGKVFTPIIGSITLTDEFTYKEDEV